MKGEFLHDYPQFMARKQQRYRAPQIEAVLPDLKGQHISLILKERQVYTVKVVGIEKDLLVVTDGLLRVHRFPFTLIDEVIVEKHA